MYSISSNSGHTAYGTKDFICDTVADIADLPIDITPGSTAFVIEGSLCYMLNNSQTWVEV